MEEKEILENLETEESFNSETVEEQSYFQKEGVDIKEEVVGQNGFVFIPAKEQDKPKKASVLFVFSMVFSLWSILLCVFYVIGAICASVGLVLFLIGVKKPKTTSYKWALSLNIVAIIVTAIFCVIL